MNSVYNCCKICGKVLSGRQDSFCSTQCKNKYFQSYEKQVSRGLKNRQILIEKFGGKCSICTYSASPSTLVFMKDYKKLSLSLRQLANHDQEYLFKKLDGAILVCKNCASEIENNDIKDKINQKKFDIAKFQKNLRTLDITPETPLVLGVSGGVDSIVMLDLIAKNKYQNVTVAHLNHGVRSEAKSDQDFVRELTGRYGYRFKTKDIKPPKKGNLENELRKSRRDFLIEVATKYDATHILLAHNADDQAETILLNLIRGSGLAGLSGMKMLDKHSNILQNVRMFIARPLLNISRAEIEAFAAENKLEWVVDVTNFDTTYKRNYIRHKILPLFENLNPEYLDSFQRASSLIGDVDTHLKKEASAVLNTVKSDGTIDIDLLKKYDDALKREIIMMMYENVANTRDDVTLQNLLDLDRLTSNTNGTKSIHLPNSVIARRSYCTLEFLKKKEDNTLPVKPLKIQASNLVFNAWEFDILPVESETKSPRKDFLIIPASELSQISVRGWKPGDRIEKEGLKGKKKLQDLFTDGKIERVKRKNWPVFVDNNDEILWVPLLSFSRNRYKKSNNLMKIIIKKGIDEK